MILSGHNFAIRTVSIETVINCVFFAFESRQIQIRVPYNKLPTNLASSSRTGEYWRSVVFVRSSLRSVRTATTSGQYSSVRPSRSVSKRLTFPKGHECARCEKDLEGWKRQGVLLTALSAADLVISYKDLWICEVRYQKLPLVMTHTKTK